MNHIIILEELLTKQYQRNVRINLCIEKMLVEKYFTWIKLENRNNYLVGSGTLKLNGNKYNVKLKYSPFYPNHFDRIFVEGVHYHSKIHLYSDMSLCLYHPKIDTSPFKIIPLVKIIPWISEWCINYENWKRYGVWLGDEIQH